MHLSTHNWMRFEPLEVSLARISKLGFKSIELSGEPSQYETRATRKLLQDYKIKCWGAVTLTLGNRNLASANASYRASTVSYMKDVITMVSELDGEMITLVPGTVGKVTPEASPEEEWQWLVEGCTECYEHGLRKGVKIAIEALNRFETYLINRTDQSLALAKAVGRDCGVCLDAFHMNIEDVDLFESIAKCGRRIYDFHVADNNRMAAGQGNFDWKKILRALKKAGYDGALTVEFVAPIDRTPANKYPEQIERNPVNISPEQLKFIQDHGSNLLSDKFYTALMRKSAKTILPLIK